MAVHTEIETEPEKRYNITGEKSVNPVHTSCWKPVKKKYLGFPPRFYLTRYQNLFKNT